MAKEEARAHKIMYPKFRSWDFCPDNEKSVRKGFYAGKEHDSETTLWWLVGNGAGRSWRFGGWLKDKA